MTLTHKKVALGAPAWTYRCFWVRPKGDGWQPINAFPALSPDIPHKFIWNFREDKEGLCRYIDTLLTGQRSEASAIEMSGAVSDVEMFHSDRPKDTIIRVSVRRFIDYLRLRDHFDVPLWGKVHFITDGSNIIPREFIAAVGQMLGNDGNFLDPTKPWKHCTEQDLAAMGLKTSDITSSMNRKRFPRVNPTLENMTTNADEFDGEAPPAPPREIELYREVFDRYVDMLTQVVPEDNKPYFTRRIISVSGPILWCGTSYERSGPWRVWTRNTAELLALGLNL